MKNFLQLLFIFFIFALAAHGLTLTSLHAAVSRPQAGHAQHTPLQPILHFTTSDSIKPEHKNSRLEIINALVFGVVAGAFLGAATGMRADSRDGFISGLRGGIIGASTFPFLFYEHATRNSRHAKSKRKLGVTLGGGFTYPDYDAAVVSPGFILGLQRVYGITERIALRAEVAYAVRRFTLRDQTLGLYSSLRPKRYQSDVHFSVGYVETAFMFQYRLRTARRLGWAFALGPAVSVVVRNKTRYDFSREIETQPDNLNLDFIYQNDEPARILLYPNMNFILSVNPGRVNLHVGFKRAWLRTHQIFPLAERSRFNTLEFTLGYYF